MVPLSGTSIFLGFVGVERMGETAVQLAPGAARALRGAVLALIIEQPSHGYEVAARLNRRLGPSSQIEPKQIYPMLDQLEGAHFLTSRIEHVPGRPRQTRTVYEATDAASEVVEEWLSSKVEKTPLREDVWARIACARPGQAKKVLRALDQYEQEILRQIEANDEDDPPVRSWKTLTLAIVREQTDAHLRGELMVIVNARRRINEFLAEHGDR
jgi:DNA-binding PadR family transcriptional regulator